jgi:hypothetical protein
MARLTREVFTRINMFSVVDETVSSVQVFDLSILSYMRSINNLDLIISSNWILVAIKRDCIM